MSRWPAQLHGHSTAHVVSGCWNRRCRTPDRAMVGMAEMGWVRAAGLCAGSPGKDTGLKWQGFGQGHREEGQGQGQAGASEGRRGRTQAAARAKEGPNGPTNSSDIPSGRETIGRVQPPFTAH